MAGARRIQLAATLALALALLAAGTLALGARADAVRMAGELSREHQPELLVGELSTALLATESSELAYLLTAQPGRLAAFDQARQRISELTSELARRVESPAEREELIGIRSAVSRQLAAQSRLLSQPPGGHGDPQLIAASTRLDQELTGVLSRLDALALSYRQQAHERRDRQQAAVARATLAIDVLSSALLLLIGVVVMQWRVALKARPSA